MSEPDEPEGRAAPPGDAGRRPPRGDAGSRSVPRTPLPGDVRKALIELAVALHRHAMYPPDHPALRPATDVLFDALGRVLREQGTLRVEGLRDRLVVGGARSDPSSPHLAGLAGRLHDHQLAAVEFHAGLDAPELSALLQALSEEPARGAEPLGLSDAGARRWTHLRLIPQSYEPLHLDEEGRTVGERPGAPRGTAPPATPPPAVGGRIGDSDLVTEDPEDVARRLEAGLGDEDADRVVALQVVRLAERLGSARGRRAALVRRKMSRLILCLRPETLSYLVRFGSEGGRTDDLLVSAAAGLDTEAALRLVQAAAEGREGSIEDWLLRLMKKLAMYAGPRDRAGGAGGQTEETAREPAIHEVVDRIVTDWQLEDPRPSVYQDTLEHIAGTPPAQARRPRRKLVVEPERVIQMGLEMEEPALPVREAVDELLEDRRSRDLIGMADRVTEPNRAAEALWTRLTVPETIEGLLLEPDPDFDLIGRIVGRGGVRVAGPLLDALSDPNAESRSYWHNVFSLLVEMGQPVLELLPERLEDERWFVRRNLLALLNEVPGRPQGFTALPFLEDPDARVRTEALKAALREPDGRVPALAAGLRDDDARVAGLALSAAARDGLPAELESIVAARTADGTLPPAVRTRAVRVLAAGGSDAARKALLDLAWVRRWIFWRRIPAPTRPVLAALEALARGWPSHPDVAPVLEAAAASDDPEVRGAAAGLGDGEPSSEGEA